MSASKPSRRRTRISAGSRCPSAPRNPTTGNGASSSSSSRPCLRHRCSKRAVDIRSQPERHGPAQRCRADQRPRCVPQRRRAEPVQRDAARLRVQQPVYAPGRDPHLQDRASRASTRTTNPFPKQNFGGSFTFSNLAIVRRRPGAQLPGHPRRSAARSQPVRGVVVPAERHQADAARHADGSASGTTRKPTSARGTISRRGWDSPTPSASPRSFARAPGSSTVALELQVVEDAAASGRHAPVRAHRRQGVVSGSIPVRARFATRCRPCRSSIPNLDVPSIGIVHASFERTFFRTLLFSTSYEHNRDRRLRFRNLNAPLPGQTVRPDPARGNILNVESSGGAVGNTSGSPIATGSASSTSRRPTRDAKLGRRRPRQPVAPGEQLRSGGGVGPDSHARSPVQRHVNTRLPLGIFLASVVTANSGRAYTITTGRDDNNDTQVNDRPPGGKRFGERGPAFLQDRLQHLEGVLPRRGSGRWRRVPDQRQRLHQHDQCVQPHEPRAAVRGDDLAEFRQIHQRGKPSRDRGGLRFQF